MTTKRETFFTVLERDGYLATHKFCLVIRLKEEPGPTIIFVNRYVYIIRSRLLYDNKLFFSSKKTFDMR